MANNDGVGVVKKPIIPVWAQIVAAGCIVLLLVKLCPNKVEDKNGEIAALHERHLRDSIDGLAVQKRYVDSSALLRNQVLIAKDSTKLANKKLDNAIKENKRLVDKYLVTWSGHIPFDTSAILMPAEFANDCKDCFEQLDRTNEAISGYKNQSDMLQDLLITQSKLDSTEIVRLQDEKLQLNKDYNDMRMAVEVQARSMEPRRKIKTGLAGRLNQSFIPDGVGPSIMYEDKQGRDYSIKALFGKGSPMYVIDVHAPFSLRNK